MKSGKMQKIQGLQQLENEEDKKYEDENLEDVEDSANKEPAEINMYKKTNQRKETSRMFYRYVMLTYTTRHHVNIYRQATTGQNK